MLTARGDNAWFGWARNPASKELRAEFMAGSDPDAQKEIAERDLHGQTIRKAARSGHPDLPLPDGRERTQPPVASNT